MKVCKNFIEKQGTTSATICQNCGCEKWEHDVQGKGILEYIKNTPLGQKTMEVFNEALEEEFNKELRENGFLAFKEFFITTENGKK